MSVAGAPPAGREAQPVPQPPAPNPWETCPMCGAPLHADQEWCLSCGAAARTRLAAAPGWKGPVVALAVVAVLALGVLAAALVKLAGDSSSPAPASTRTVLTVPSSTSGAAGGNMSGAAGASTSATTHGAAPGRASAPGAAGATSTPALKSPSTSTSTAERGGNGLSLPSPRTRERLRRLLNLHPGSALGTLVRRAKR